MRGIGVPQGQPASPPRSPRSPRFVLVAAWLLALLAILQGNGPLPGAMETRLDRLVADIRFDFWGWKAEADWGKFTLWLLQPQRYMTEADRCAFARDYARRVERVRELERKIIEVYSDPSVKDPAAATAEVRARREQARQEIAVRQPIAEAIMEEQIGVVLARDASGILGQPSPIVGIHITSLPHVLVVSLRERVTIIYQEGLVPGITADVASALEEKVDRTFGVSSLVTSIGGMASWPAMILEYPDLAWWLEVTAHEWVHHYLLFFPLGWEYGHREARVINETVASIVGQEVARRTLARYYPDLVPKGEPFYEKEESPPLRQESAEPPAFDFRAEMYKTRVRVDWLLLHGRIEETEAYMERRRQVFREHGYSIRKLNQAYFAFYGSYADEPGAAGADPIGPAVRRLWRQTRDLRRFLHQARNVTSLEELEAILGP